MKLHDDLTPKTAEHFRLLCTGEAGDGAFTYGGTQFHRMVESFMAQGGAVDNYHVMFDDENFLTNHTKPGQLSMANAGPNTNGAEFFITFTACPWLDGKHTVFGEVERGDANSEILTRLNHYASHDGMPKATITIEKSGQLKKSLF